MTLETKEALENLTSSFESFKAANDQRLKELEEKGSTDVLTEEKLARINQDLDGLQQKMNRLYSASRRPALGDGDRPENDRETKAAFYDGFIRKGMVTGLEEKALNSLSGEDGGYTVPQELDRELEKRLRLLSPIRSDAKVVSIGSSRYKKLVNVGGIASGWVAETDARAETDTPKLAEIDPPLGELYANPAATQVMLDDAHFDVEQWLGEELAEEFAIQENAAFVAGDGVNKPKGFLTYTTSANEDTSRSFGEIQAIASGVDGDWAASDPADVLIDLVHSMKTGYRTGAKFYLNTGLLAEIRKFKDQDGNYLWRPGLESGAASSLLGYPVVEVADMPDRASGSLSVAFANMRRAYTVTDRMGTRILRDPYSHKPYIHFYTTKRVGGAVTNDQAIKLLQFAA
ncbi:phage major capsid protein [Emcibacter nanhaiensis]|uniref:Phage major capsid protein n=1 Tax=Emcibacter nanhaiensis TaxID=1505037 RepID=A0A501PCK4_9PROT|nr:phage major capsid protein [Emcibacter nanhaiensis]TPD57752.1 phage major capsid protein [Emcibacter nanhaiensis]